MQQLATRFQPHDHAVQFYADEAFLADVVADYLRAGADAGERLLLLLTIPHQAAVLQRLAAGGLNTDAALAGGQLVMYDAELMLEAIMREGMPVEALFNRHILAAVEAAGPAPTRAFGELVDLLCAQGNAMAAVQLEALWHAACHRLPLTLLCGYELRHFDRPEDQAAFNAICDHHTHVLLAENFCLLRPGQQLREVVRLQQPVKSLDLGHGSHAQMEQALRAAFHGALARNELELLYRPLLCARSGQVVAVSAQPRWRSSRFGVLESECWMGAAADNGQLADICQWILTNACQHAKSWFEVGIGLRVVVPVAIEGLLDGEFPDRVDGALASSNLPARLLEIEVTESGLMQEIQRVAQVLEQLDAKGVRLSMDGFGSGYSILGHLSRLPFDALKLGGLFIGECLDNPRHQAVIRSIIGMAHELDLEVVANSISTRQQADYLRQQGCDLLQGSLWARMEYLDPELDEP
ncbi:EAL domain-containing protein [Halomonas sp. BC04]|uniref:EAL domain-containing protein n=1 Tax=Halomonas sp. BC04 TaxID=1403540 RepID=UPI0003ED6CEA|nr:EAL domain-containing protein [Halomonas sp. BC04]EWG98977.1 hypothetical protein Q427_27555 [Halomonas sp. BC04]